MSNEMRFEGIDQIDHQFLKLLQEDDRMPFSDIGIHVGLSRTAVKNRITATEKAGIISGFRAIIKPQPQNQPTFVVNIETKAENFEEVKRALTNAEEALAVVQTTGKCHLLVMCLAPNFSAMRDFLSRIYKAAPGILGINVHSVIDTVKGSQFPEQIKIEVREHEQREINPASGGENG